MGTVSGEPRRGEHISVRRSLAMDSNAHLRVDFNVVCLGVRIQNSADVGQRPHGDRSGCATNVNDKLQSPIPTETFDPLHKFRMTGETTADPERTDVWFGEEHWKMTEVRPIVKPGCEFDRRKERWSPGRGGQDRARKAIDSTRLFSHSLKGHHEPQTIVKKILDSAAPFAYTFAYPSEDVLELSRTSSPAVAIAK